MLFKKLLGTFLFFGILLSPLAQAENKAPVSTPTSPEMEKRLANIERLLQSNGLLDMLQQIERLQQEVAKLRGEIEVSNHALGQMKNRQRDLYTDIDRRLQTIEGQSTSVNSINNPPPLETLGQTETITPPPNPDGTQADAVALTLEQSEPQPDDNQTPEVEQVTEAPVANSTPATTQTDPVQIQAQYQQAFKLLKQSQYDQAIKAFNKFIKAYPGNEYSDNAQYWMAEALYVKRQYEDAIVEYKNLVSNYPDFQKVPQGLLKIGYSYQELGENETAKLWYTDVRQRFPGTTESRLADDRLKHINDS